MKKSELFGLALVVTMASFTACSNDIEEVLPENEIKLTSEITRSRVTSLDYQSTQIVAGQKVGVTITGANSEHSNGEWTVGDNGTLTNEGESVYYGNSTATITAYHPYNSAWTETSHLFSVNTDQSIEANYRNSDLLWATASSSKTENAISLVFTHTLAKVNVTLTSTDIADLSGAIIYICGTNVRTIFNPASGELSAATADVREIKAGVTTTTDYTASAIVVPQTVSSGTSFIKVVHGDKTFFYTLTADKELKSGYSHNYTLTVKEKWMEVEAESDKINDWENEDGNVGDAEETEVFTNSTVAEMPSQDSEGTYLISSASNLKWFMDNGSSLNYNSANYKLTTDIYFENTSWTPVTFQGNFDGGNHILENIAFAGYNKGAYGFFSSMSGTVKNLVFKNPTIKQTDDNDYYGVSSGLLAAKASGTIINCGVIGGNISVSSTSRARVNGGGLIGAVSTGTTIRGCYVIDTTIKGRSDNPTRLGGLIGSIGDDASVSNINITSCYTKDITISGDDGCTMGTFIGDAYYLSTSEPSEISKCYYDNSINAIGGSGSDRFTFDTFEALTTDNFTTAIGDMNTMLTDCDYIFGTDGLFVKQ